MIDWLACTLVKAAGWCLCRLPPAAVVWFGEQLGGLSYWLQPKRARIGITNVRSAFDGHLTISETRRIVRACFQQLGAGLLEMLRLPAMDEAYVDHYITIEGQRYVDEAVASGRPVIFLTGHYGNWELASIAAALKGYPIVALARVQQKLPRLYRLLVAYRESKGCRIVHKGGAMRQLIAALRERKLIGIVGDQASRQGIAVNFFGRPAFFAVGPFELARSKGATILPTFIQRLRGPFHRIVVEPPMVLDRTVAKPESIRGAVEQFANIIARHIADDPSQWLWMHKRWKHTPARRMLVLSDGKAGHLKQALAVAEALRQTHDQITYEVVDIRYRHRLARGLALLWSWWMPTQVGAATCLQLVLTPESACALLTRYADLIISCGASTAPANLLWARENGAKAVVIMNPAPIPLRRFHLVIAPRHDGLPQRSNIVQTVGAMSWMEDNALLEARGRLHAHPNFRLDVTNETRSPVIAVFIGGETLHYELSTSFADRLIEQVLIACEAVGGWCLVTTSRRTTPAVEQLLTERLKTHPRCRFLLIASRDPMDGTMEGMLGWADVAVVTGESISMVSEAVTSGRPVVVVEPPLREAHRTALTKHRRFLYQLVREGYVRLHPVPEVGHAIQRALRAQEKAKRLDNLTPVRNALARLLS